MKTQRLLWISFVIFFVVITFSVTYYFVYLYNSYVHETKRSLESYEKNSIYLVNNWLRERNREIYFLRSPEIQTKLIKGIIVGSDDQSKNDFLGLIQSMIEHHYYDNLVIANGQREILYVFRELDSSTIFFIRNELNQYLLNLKNDTTIWLVNFNKLENKFVLCSFSKISLRINHNQSPLYCISIFDVDSTLLPLISSIESDKKTFELFVAWHNKDSVYPITPLRFRKDVKGELGFSEKDVTRPMIKSALGFVGFGDGIDYRGANVFFVANKIPQMDAFVVAKIDKEETFGNYNTILLLSLLTYIVFFGGFILLIKFYTKKDREEQLLAEIESNKQKYFVAKKYELLTKNANDLIIIWDNKGKIIESNKKAEKVLGYTTEEMLQLSFEDLFADDVNNAEWGQFLDTTCKESRIIETKVKRRDGSVLFAEISKSLIEYGNEEVIITIIRDITEHKVAMDKIGKLNRLLLVLSQINQVIIRKIELNTLFNDVCRIITEFGEFKMSILLRYFEDDNKFVVVTNSGLDSSVLFEEEFTYNECVYKYPFLALNFEDIISSNTNTVVYYNNLVDEFDFPEDIRKVFLSEQLFSVALIPVIAGDRLFGLVVVFSDNPVFFDHEEVNILEEMGKDFSFAVDKYLEEQKYFESEFKRKLFFDSAPNLFLLTDGEGIIIDANRTFAKVFGIGQKEIRRKNFFDILPESIRDESKEQFLKIIEKKEYRFYLKIESENDKTRWFFVTGSYVQEFDFVLLVISDLTEIYEMEMQLRDEKNRAELANEVKTHILNNISHEFRTPINNILGFSKILQINYQDSDLKEIGDSIYISGSRLYNILESLIYTSRLVGGTVVPKFEGTYLTYFCKKIRNSFEPFASIKNLSFNIEISKNLEQVVTDIELLSMLMSCLIDNAIKFTDEGGITITCEKSIDGESDNWMLKVSDTGIGISKEKSDVIFELFRQGSEGIARQYEGLGIGLFLAKKIVEILGGNIRFESKVGKGTIFVVTLPIFHHID